MDNVRVRFAPSPTGALHIGGVRTALFNYLFAKKNNGTFILRVEDTDQSRFVPGAEAYINEALAWCGITASESPSVGGPYAPYRQSDRKDIYGKYVQQLLDSGYAYCAFDTPEELDQMRLRLKTTKAINQQYNSITRMTMKNSMTLSSEEVDGLKKANHPFVVRLKIPHKEEIRMNDMIRGWVMVHSSTLDDKVLMKSDGMPTYHLANVVDDHLMKITHVIRGEEWLPSAPTHALLYRYLGWENTMPHFAHLPLILKPDGNGKLSKRAADQLGFPIFPLDWTDPDTNEVSKGFKESGFLPDALINFLAFLGWNPGTEQEIFSMEELVAAFSLEKVNKSGTKFDLEKIRWFNQQYIKSINSSHLAADFIEVLKVNHGHVCSSQMAIEIVDLLKDRITFPKELVELSLPLFEEPKAYDHAVVSKKLTEETAKGLNLFAEILLESGNLNADEIRQLFSNTLNKEGINPGKVMQMLRVVISGEAAGPDLMEMLSIMGSKNASQRIRYSLNELKDKIQS